MVQKSKWLIVFALPILIGCATSLKIVTTEPDAKIYVDNQFKGTGKAEVKLDKNETVTVRVEKPGFLSVVESFTNDKNFSPRAEFKMEKDLSFDASVQSNIANTDFSQEVNKRKYNEDSAWKLILSIITNYFDEIEISDKGSGYLKTAWVINTFNNGAVIVRTRAIVKCSNSDPLTYKIKIVSEKAPDPNAPAKVPKDAKITARNDEYFGPWDRVLNKYKDLVSEFQTRLSK